MVENDPLIPSDDAAAILKIKPTTLPSWRSMGRGPRFVKVGRAVFYRESAIRAWLSDQERDPRAKVVSIQAAKASKALPAERAPEKGAA